MWYVLTPGFNAESYRLENPPASCACMCLHHHHRGSLSACRHQGKQVQTILIWYYILDCTCHRKALFWSVNEVTHQMDRCTDFLTIWDHNRIAVICHSWSKRVVACRSVVSLRCNSTMKSIMISTLYSCIFRALFNFWCFSMDAVALLPERAVNGCPRCDSRVHSQLVFLLVLSSRYLSIFCF